MSPEQDPTTPLAAADVQLQDLPIVDVQRNPLPKYGCCHAQFGDLPNELVDMVIRHSAKRSTWLLVAKRYLHLAGKAIYSQGITDKYASGLEASKATSAPLVSVLEGIQWQLPTAEAPYGRDLKLRFLRYAETLRYPLVIDTVQVPSELLDRTRKMTAALCVLAMEGTILFPNLYKLQLLPLPCLSTSPLSTIDTLRLFSLSLAAVCHPAHFSWPFAIDEYDHTPNHMPYRPLTLAPRPRIWLWWGKRDRRNLPRLVTHTIMRKDQDVPMVCYGAVNEVDLTAVSDEEGAVECAMRIARILRIAHPEMQLGHVREGLSKEEQKDRAETEWCFKWNSIFRREYTALGIPALVDEEELEELLCGEFGEMIEDGRLWFSISCAKESPLCL
ncbi:hypothetical protein IAT38_000759 [Cryptococcus sp. DSM 104549]